jgi:hypothetical protein
VSGAYLSIDYGTSNTVAAVRWPDGRIRPLLFDGSPSLPSAVFCQPDGALLTGRDAVHSARLDPARYEPNPKRRIDEGTLLLGDRSLAVAEAIAATLRRVGAEAARTAGGLPGAVVLTYPAGWGAVRRGVLVEASALAGLPQPVLLAEPVAATAYFTAVLGHAVRPGQLLVVYDLGAGTFDLSVVRRTGDGFEVADVDGMADFGGLDLDGLLVGRVAAAVQPGDPHVWRRLSSPQTPLDRRHFRTLWDDARTAKEMLSREPAAGLHVPLVEREVLVSRDEFETAAAPHLQAAAALTGKVMRRCGVTAANLAGIFLVGGASRVPLAATTLHRATRVAPTVLEQPETVVAEGALHAVARTAPAAAVGSPPPPPAAAPVAAPAAPATPAPAPVTPQPPDLSSRALWRLVGTALLSAAPLIALLAEIPPFEVLVLALVIGLPGALLLRRGLRWQPPFGYGIARERKGIGRGAVALLTIASMLVGGSFAGLRFQLSHPAASSTWTVVLVFAVLAAAALATGIWLLRAFHRPYPRLIVHHAGLTYQANPGTTNDLPWTDLARVDITSVRAGQPPTLLAYPTPDSPLPHDPRYAALWRRDLGAFTLNDLEPMLTDPQTDTPRLADAIARHRAQHPPANTSR